MNTAKHLANAARAFTWETFRIARPAAALCAALLFSCIVFNVVWPVPPPVSGWPARATLFTFLMVISLGLGFAMFHSTEFQAGKDWHGFPYRRFVLPVPTLLLVGCPMLLGLACVELIEIAWARLIFAPIGVHVPSWLSLVIGTGLLSFQAVLWSLAGFRVTRIIVLSAVALFLANVSFLLMEPQLAPGISPAIRLICPIALGCLAIAIAWFSVERQRRGGGRSRGWLPGTLMRLADWVPRRRRAFTSPAGAQFWYEWRRAGWLLPASTLAALLLIFVPIASFCRHDPDAAWWILGWAAALPILMALVIGKGVCKPDVWSASLSLPQWLAVRPVTNGDLLVSKMKVAAVSALLSWLFVLGFVAIWFSWFADTTEVRGLLRDWAAAKGVVAPTAAALLLPAGGLALTWRFLVIDLWVGLAGSRKRYFALLSASVVTLGLGITVFVFAINHYRPEHLGSTVTWIGWALLFGALLKIWTAPLAWSRITRPRLLRFALLWTVGTAFLLVLAYAACPGIFWLRHLVMLAALLPIPLARPGLAPRSLASNRHRT